MVSLSRSKALIAFLIFAGLIMAGVGILATQSPDDLVTEAPTENPVLMTPPGTTTAISVTGSKDRPSEDAHGQSDTQSKVRTEGDTAEQRAGPPPLFPTKDVTTRKGYYLAFSALCRKSPEEFRKLARTAFDGPYPRAAKEAALAAWYDWNDENRLGPYTQLLTAKPSSDHTNAIPKSLRGFAVKHLAEKAPSEAESRALLSDFLETRPSDVQLRIQAYRAVLRWGDMKELNRCLPTILAESDASCLKASAEALHQATEGAAELMLRDLAKRHPRASARAEFKQLLAKD